MADVRRVLAGMVRAPTKRRLLHENIDEIKWAEELVQANVQ